MTLSQDTNSSIIAHMFADHPKTEKRAEKMKKMAEEYEAKSSR
jgi:Zn-dependent protease with chaperone function